MERMLEFSTVLSALSPYLGHIWEENEEGTG